jgi:Acyl-CoA dehydrogenase, C-terminal domain
MDNDTLGLLRSSLRYVLSQESSRPLDERLADLGWSDVVADDDGVATITLFEVLGDMLSAADAVGPQVAEALANALGILPIPVVLPLRGTPAATPTDGGLRVDGVLLGGRIPVGEVAFATADGSVFAADIAGLALVPGHGFDDSLGMLHVSGDVSDARPLGDNQAWTAALARGRAVLAVELVAISHHVIRAAVDYTGARVQYGKAIGTFQALQHRLASAHTLVIAAGRLANEAVMTGDAWTALVAKSLAGHAAENACTQAQQCYGAIGFTWEHEFHRYLRRTYALDALLGDWRTLEHEIGMTLQATGTVPRIGTM